MLADPGLVIVKPIEMDQEIHIAVEGEQRVFGQWMKRSEKNARPQKSLGHKNGVTMRARWMIITIRLPALAAELVEHQVAVIAANFLPAALAAKGATQTIPMVLLSGAIRLGRDSYRIGDVVRVTSLRLRRGVPF